MRNKDDLRINNGCAGAAVTIMGFVVIFATAMVLSILVMKILEVIQNGLGTIF